MVYRELGNTGKKVSMIGLGCEYLDRKPYEQVKETICASLEEGVNILDVFMPGTDVRENIAKALGDRRKDVYIQGHIGSTDINQQYDISRDLPTVKKYFEELLRIFGYIDFGMMFFVDSKEDYQKIFDTEFITYVEKLKKQGDIHHIGFSSHNPETAAKVVQTGIAEVMMFSINPVFDMIPFEETSLQAMEKVALKGIDPTRANLYKLCSKKQVGITVMKTFGGGKLLSKQHSPFAKPLSVIQCIHYALSRPAVSSVLPGCQSRNEIAEAMKYLTATEAERDYTEILKDTRSDFRGKCVYCGHCQPCPVGIDIAALNKYLDIACLDENDILPSIRSHYSCLEHKADECIACGNCEVRCPFDVPIIENMKKANELFV